MSTADRNQSGYEFFLKFCDVVNNLHTSSASILLNAPELTYDILLKTAELVLGYGLSLR